LHISSRQNALYKALLRIVRGKRLSSGPLGQISRPVLLEGLHLCEEWLGHQGAPLYAIFDEQSLEAERPLQRLKRQLPDQISIYMDSALLASLSHIGASQGVVFLVSAPHPPAVVSDHISALWLDRVQDPGNVGTLLRTAAAAGLTVAVLSEGCARAWSPRVLRSAQGAHFSLHIHEDADLAALARELAMPLYATGLGPDTVSLYDAVLEAPCVWIAGNEGQGVDADLFAQAAQVIHIPQDDQVESLNVAVATGICLFEQRRRALDRAT